MGYAEEAMPDIERRIRDMESDVEVLRSDVEVLREVTNTKISIMQCDIAELKKGKVEEHIKIARALEMKIDGLKIVKRRIERLNLPTWDEEKETLDDVIKTLEELKEEHLSGLLEE